MLSQQFHVKSFNSHTCLISEVAMLYNFIVDVGSIVLYWKFHQFLWLHANRYHGALNADLISEGGQENVINIT